MRPKTEISAIKAGIQAAPEITGIVEIRVAISEDDIMVGISIDATMLAKGETNDIVPNTKT